MSQVISGVGGVINQIRTFIESGFSTIKQAIFNQLQFVVDQIGGLLVGIPSKIAGLLGGIQQALVPLFDSLRAFFQTVFSSINQAINGVIIPILSQIPARISALLGSIGATISNLITPVFNSISGIARQILGFVTNIPTQVFSQLERVRTFIADTINQLLGRFGEGFNTLSAMVRSTVQGTSDLISGFNQFSFQAGKGFADLGSQIQNVATGFFGEIYKNIQGAKSAIIDPLLALPQTILNQVRSTFRPTGSITPEDARAQLNAAGLPIVGGFVGATIAGSILEIISAGQLDQIANGVIATMNQLGFNVISTDYLTAEYTIGVRPALIREILARYEPMIPSTTDLVTMVVKEAFVPELVTPAPEIFAKFLREQGFTKAWADRFWTAHWRPIDFDRATDMFHRGIIDEADYIKRLIILDFRPTDAELVRKLTFRLPNRIEARVMSRFGLLSDEQINEVIRAEGIREDFVEPLRVMMQEFNLTSAFTRQETAAISGFKDGLLGESQARTLMAQIKRPQAVIDADINLARLQRGLELKRDMIRAIEAASRKGLVSESRARQEYTKLGLDPDVLEGQIAIVKFQIEINTTKDVKALGKDLTPAQIAKAVQLGKIPLDEGLASISARGYDANEARILIELAAKTK